MLTVKTQTNLLKHLTGATEKLVIYIYNLTVIPTNMCGKKLYIVPKKSWEEIEIVIRISINCN